MADAPHCTRSISLAQSLPRCLVRAPLVRATVGAFPSPELQTEPAMSSTRREFLGHTVVLGSAAAGSLSPKWSALARPLPAPKRILILGGTGFIGPKTVEAALARGHKVSVFNRGHREKYRPLAFKDVEHLYGTRG